MRITTWAHLVTAAVLFQFVISTRVSPQARNNIVEEAASNIVAARSELRNKVLDVKASYTPKDASYTKAKSLYQDARRDYDAWAHYVAASVRNRKLGRLHNDKAYADKARLATNSSQAFINYVSTITPEKKSAWLGVLASLTEIGLKVWTALSAEQEKEAQSRADWFLKDVAWEDWENIVPVR